MTTSITVRRERRMKRRRRLGALAALAAAALTAALTAAPASAATRDIVVQLTNNSNSSLTGADLVLDHGCWRAKPPKNIAIGQTVDISSESCGTATGTEFHVSYTLDLTGTTMSLHYDNPFAGDDSFDETAPPGYAFDAGGTIEARTVNFRCEPKDCGEIPIRAHVTNNSDSSLTLADWKADGGCWAATPPTTIAIGQTVDIASQACGTTTGTEFHVSYKLDRTGTKMSLHYNSPLRGKDTFEETAPQGYAFDAGGAIDDRTVSFGCNSTVCDGIPDDWKRNGVTIDPGGGNPAQFVDLPKMGVSLDRPDVLVQLDWMQDTTHNQQLRQAAIDTVIKAFDQDPVTYHGAARPGITLIVDAGPDSTITPGGAKWNSLSRAKQIPWTQGFLTGNRNAGYQLANFYTQLKNSLVPAGRLPIFHYAVAADEIAMNDSTSGLTDAGLLGFMVTLGDWDGNVGSPDQQTGTFMHELGHTLGLDHSGGEGNADNVNYKPNYPSVMNYAYQMRGVFRGGVQVFDYSRDPMPDVGETALTEAGGVDLGANPSGYGTTHSCGTKDSNGNVSITETDIQAALKPVDWNCDKATPNGSTGFDANGDTAQGTLKGTDKPDWNRLEFLTGGVGAGGNAKDSVTIPGSGVSAPSEELTAEQDRLIRVLPLETRLTYNGASTADYHDGVTMSATLADAADGSPVTGKTIIFQIGSGSSDTCSATTDATGTASCGVNVAQAPGDYPITAKFGGDAIYKAAADLNHTFTITREETSIAYTGDVKLANGVPAHLAGSLTEDGVTPIAGAGVELTAGTGTAQQSCTAVTDGSGAARCTIPALAQPLDADASVPLAAAFDGDQNYLPSNASATGMLNYMTGRAFGLSADVSLLLASLHLPPQPDTGPVRTASALTTATPCTASVDTALISAHGVCPEVTATLAPGTSTATSTVQDATIGIAGLPVIKATAIRSVSRSTCSAATGSVSIDHLTVGGKAVDTSVAPNSGIDLGGGARLVLNEQLPAQGADHGLTVNALHLTVLGGGADVVVASSSSSIHNC